MTEPRLQVSCGTNCLSICFSGVYHTLGEQTEYLSSHTFILSMCPFVLLLHCASNLCNKQYLEGKIGPSYVNMDIYVTYIDIYINCKCCRCSEHQPAKKKKKIAHWGTPVPVCSRLSSACGRQVALGSCKEASDKSNWHWSTLEPKRHFKRHPKACLDWNLQLKGETIILWLEKWPRALGMSDFW